MANKVLNTRIALCADTSANLIASTKVYLKGEAIVEFCEDGSVKLKVGDGINTFSDLKYISGGGSGAGEVYTVVQEDTTDIDTAVATLGLTNLKGGEMVIITSDASLSSAACSGYVYVIDGENKGWHAFAGNVTSDKVIISQNFIGAGNWSNCANITKTQSGTVNLNWQSKTLNDVLTAIFSKELQPSKTEPSVSITFAIGGQSYEVGTTVTPSYSATLNSGSYTYGPATSVVASAWSVTDTSGNSSTSAADSFPAFVVDDDTNYKITATATHNEGAVAVTNLGNPSNPEVKIAAGTKSKTSGSVTGYRSWFYGAVNLSGAITSSVIRGLTNGKAYNASTKVTVNASDVTGANAIIVAYPASSTRSGITKVELASSLYADITGQYVQQDDVLVEGVNGHTSVNYHVFKYQPASLDAGERHDIYMG